ncbi:MAG: hypothetical protein AAGI51_11015 [Pseudomonadota bacterium]
MDGADLAPYGAIDAALLGAFYMSYGVLGLVQIANLFEGRALRFAAILGGAAALGQGFGLLDYSGFCAVRSSAVICNHGARGLVGLATPWVWVSLAMLALFGMSKGLGRLSGAHERAETSPRPEPGPD